MGRSSKFSCFKFMACDGDLAGCGNTASVESKATLDKGRWSFRKRSSRNLVKSNSVISEPCFNMKMPETITNDFHSEKESPVPENPTILEETNEKPPFRVPLDSEVAGMVHSSVPKRPPRLEQANETTPLSALIDPEVSDSLLAAELTTTIDNNFQEGVVTVIQAAIRRYLAQKELEKCKNIVKLQAAIRGHLVRRQAVGTLRCAQAIIKMQALVRARLAHRLEEKFAAEEQLDEKPQINSSMGSDTAYASIEKLLSNAFVRLLLEPTPKMKPIHVSCDPLRSDSAWKWLERWMFVMSSETGQQQEFKLDKDCQGEKEKTNLAVSEIANVVPDPVASISSDSVSSPCESATPIDSSGDLVRKNSGEVEVHISVSIPNQSNSSVAKNDQEQSQYESEPSDMMEENSESAAPIEGEVSSIYDKSAKYLIDVPVSTTDQEMGSVAKDDQEQSQHESETSGMMEENSESAAPIEGEVSLTYENSVEYQINVPVSTPNEEMSSVARNDQEQSQCESDTWGIIKKNLRIGETFDSTASEVSVQSDATSHSLLDNTSAEPEFDMGNQKCTSERMTCESLETEGMECALRSRNAESPAFAAVQSKFEELSSVSSVSRPVTSVNQGAKVQSELVHPQIDSLTKTKGLSTVENSRSQDTIKNSALEYGTETSVSSIFDLPEISEGDGKCIVLEIGALDKGNCNLTDGADSALNNENMNCGTKFHCSESDVLQPQKLKESDGNLTSTVPAVDSAQEHQLPAESTGSSIQVQVEYLKDAQICSSSPESSPRSHVTASESHRTPSSQKSAKNKTSEAENNNHARRQKSQLACRNSPSIPKSDSGGRKGTEYLPKDAKNTKRHNTFAMAKPDHIDHESKDSSSNSVPRYMQATESSRAKVHDGISPKSSPDVDDKDDRMKKRHSLPIGDVKDSSPQVQRSTPQAQQNLRRNSSHSPQNSAA